MLRDLEALAIIVTTLATVLGYMIRRYRANRPSANLEHVRKLELEGEEIDRALRNLKADKREDAHDRRPEDHHFLG